MKILFPNNIFANGFIIVENPWWINYYAGCLQNHDFKSSIHSTFTIWNISVKRFPFPFFFYYNNGLLSFKKFIVINSLQSSLLWCSNCSKFDCWESLKLDSRFYSFGMYSSLSSIMMQQDSSYSPYTFCV